MDNKYNYEVIEVYGQVKGEPNSWGVTVSRVKWGDNPPTVNIRNTNFMKGIIGKGVSLTDEEANSVVDLLLENDYGSVEVIERALEKRKSLTRYEPIEVQYEVLEE